MKMFKKLITLYLLAFLLVPNFFVLAANPFGIGENLNIGTAVNNLAEYLFYIFGGAAVVMFIWAGFMFLMAQGDPGKTNTAKQAVIWGIVGVGVALISTSIGMIVQSLLGV